MDEQLAPVRPDLAVARLAAAQYGVVTWRQLIDAGLGRGAIAHRASIGWLHRMYRGVYAVGHPPLTREARWIAAVLAYGQGAALSHASAAAHWGLRPYAGTRIDVTVASHAGRATRPGIGLHRSVTVAADVTTHRAIPVTTVARTLLDVAATLKPAALARTIEQTEILRLFDLAAIGGTLARNPTHAGLIALRAAIDGYRPHELTRSELESAFVALCAAADLPRPLVNHVVEAEEVDFLWPGERLVVETDGRATHLTRAAFDRDRARDAKLTVAGYRVVRFTHRQVETDARGVQATLHGLLARRASR